jgi:hypothetical protein
MLKSGGKHYWSPADSERAENLMLRSLSGMAGWASQFNDASIDAPVVGDGPNAGYSPITAYLVSVYPTIGLTEKEWTRVESSPF